MRRAALHHAKFCWRPAASHACTLEPSAFLPIAAAVPQALPAGLGLQASDSAWLSGSHSLTLVAWYAKGKGQKQKAGKGKAAEPSEEDADADVDLAAVEKTMSMAVQHLQQELSKIRTGRANPGLLEPIMVETEHGRSPLRNLGTVAQRNPQLLVVSMFDTKDLTAAAAAIRESPLQLQARVEGKEVHVPVPRPSTEVLQRMAKLVHQEAEAAKAAVRHGRHQGLEAVKKATKDLPDEKFRLDKEVQKLCDRYVGEVERLKLQKDKDLKDNH